MSGLTAEQREILKSLEGACFDLDTDEMDAIRAVLALIDQQAAELERLRGLLLERHDAEKMLRGPVSKWPDDASQRSYDALIAIDREAQSLAAAREETP
jgi:hypothetical protein